MKYLKQKPKKNNKQTNKEKQRLDESLWKIGHGNRMNQCNRSKSVTKSHEEEASREHKKKRRTKSEKQNSVKKKWNFSRIKEARKADYLWDAIASNVKKNKKNGNQIKRSSLWFLFVPFYRRRF